MNLRLLCGTEKVLASPVGWLLQCKDCQGVLEMTSHYNYTSVFSCLLEAAWETHGLSWKAEARSTNSQLLTVIVFLVGGSLLKRDLSCLLGSWLPQVRKLRDVSYPSEFRLKPVSYGTFVRDHILI